MVRDIDIVSGDFWGGNPHDDLAWLRANDPVYFDEKNSIWGITRYEDVKTASKDPKSFSNAGGIRPDNDATPMMIDLDDPQHIRRRMLVNKGFTPQRVRAQEHVIRAVVDKLIDDVCEQGECDFVKDLAGWLPLIMIGDALGFDESDRPLLLEWSDDLMRGLGTEDEELVMKMMMASVAYGEYLTPIIEDRRANPRDDLISTLVHAELEGDTLDDEALFFESLLILIGGDETTRHVITGGMYQLLLNRQNWEDLRADRSLLPVAIEEMLRWVSPIKNMARTLTHDLELRGKTLKEGQKALLLYSSANRDEDQFENSMTFDIRRNPNEHVAFGFGTHFCLGASLARLELTVMFDQLLDRLPDIELATTDEPQNRPANFVSGYETMPVTFSPVAPQG